MPDLTAFVVSCPERRPILLETLERFRRTDWGRDPAVILDKGSAASSRFARINDVWRRALMAAAAAGGPSLVIEDDADLNAHIRHNLTAWPPLRAPTPLLAFLYNGAALAPWREDEWPPSPTHFAADPAKAWGAQGMLLSVSMARWLLDGWDRCPGFADSRMARLAGEIGPVWVHAPSLVQHVGATSTWGGPFHQAADFDRDWRA